MPNPPKETAFVLNKTPGAESTPTLSLSNSWWLRVTKSSYVGSSLHRWHQNCTFHLGLEPTGGGLDRSAWGRDRSPYTPRRLGSPDRPAAQTAVIQCAGPKTEPPPFSNDNTTFLWHSLGSILRADPETPKRGELSINGYISHRN